ncbi:CBS domain-containing protein [Streptomyces iconiensis]|uniref:CBS domain-containing protein n=1 Tax=Streptomyces iconiensis TaxID=1384038 RepID=A0ABT7A2D4_9ACTN|nr:CBS domain-containing protein [Streptomyces iconiensis]MDJ1135497.1 CBS domain-containing protein [Streptomyces iconiensis]
MPNVPHTVSDVMTHTVVAVGRQAGFKEIVKIMEQWKVSALPVLEGEGRVIGVVSEADLLPKEEFRDAVPSPDGGTRHVTDLAKAGASTAEELMSTPVVTVRADATLAEAARIMARRQVKRLPVTGPDGLLEGVISRSDLLKVFLRSDDDLAEEVSRKLRELFPAPVAPLEVTASEGIVTVTGTVRDSMLAPLATHLVRGVEGVVGVDCRLNTSGRPANAG